MRRIATLVFVIAYVILPALVACGADKLELLSGISMNGEVVSVTDETVTIKIGATEKTFPLEKIHAITQNGERRVIHEKEDSAAPPPKTPAVTPEPEPEKETPAKAEKKAEKPKPLKLSPQKMDALIKKEGKEKPDWWDTVTVDTPQTLNLKEWSPPQGERADPNKYPSIYIWDTLVPKPERWREAIKLTDACLKEVGNDSSKKFTVMLALAEYYRNLLNDYPRAAYYYRELMQAKPGNSTVEIGLGHCYAELGNPALAIELYRKHEKRVGRDADVVRAYTRIGETKLALKVGKALIASSSGRDKAMSLLATGDAARTAGDYKEAISLYEQVKDVTAPEKESGQDEARQIEAIKQRAEAAARVAKLCEPLNLKKIPDGTYEGKGRGHEGDIQVAVTVKNGAIEKVEVTKHKESRFYTAMTAMPERIVESQSLKVDAVTSATECSDAITAAAAAALESAMQ